MSNNGRSDGTTRRRAALLVWLGLLGAWLGYAIGRGDFGSFGPVAVVMLASLVAILSATASGGGDRRS